MIDGGRVQDGAARRSKASFVAQHELLHATRGLVHRGNLQLMKRTAYLVRVYRPEDPSSSPPSGVVVAGGADRRPISRGMKLAGGSKAD